MRTATENDQVWWRRWFYEPDRWGLSPMMNGRGIALVITVGVVTVLSVLIGASAFLSSRGCERTGREMGVASSWDFYAGCFIEVNDSMVPQDRVTWNEHGEIVIREAQ